MDLVITGFIFAMGFCFLGIGSHLKDRFFLSVAMVFFIILGFIFLFEGLA